MPALLSALCACSGAQAPKIASIGQPAPQWSEKTSSGMTLSSASLRGYPVYMNFFASWCGPCNEEAPDINAIAKRYAARGLHVVGVDELENRRQAALFVHKYGLVYPAVVDEGSLQDAYTVNALPVHVFIDRTGIVRKIVPGEMSKNAIAAAVRSVL